MCLTPWEMLQTFPSSWEMKKSAERIQKDEENARVSVKKMRTQELEATGDAAHLSPWSENKYHIISKKSN